MARTRTTIKIVDIKQPECNLYVRIEKNNFILTLCDLMGNVLHPETAGMRFSGSKKGTPHAANVTSEKMARWATDRKVQGVHVRIVGIGSTGDVALRVLENKGLTVLSVTNITGVPHGGCKPRKARRV